MTAQQQTVTRIVTSARPFSSENRARYKSDRISDVMLDACLFLVVVTGCLLIWSFFPGDAHPNLVGAGVTFGLSCVAVFVARTWDYHIVATNQAVAEKYLAEIRPTVLDETGVELPDSFVDALTNSWFAPTGWSLPNAAITVNEFGALVVETPADNPAPVA